MRKIWQWEAPKGSFHSIVEHINSIPGRPVNENIKLMCKDLLFPRRVLTCGRKMVDKSESHSPCSRLCPALPWTPQQVKWKNSREKDSYGSKKHCGEHIFLLNVRIWFIWLLICEWSHVLCHVTSSQWELLQPLNKNGIKKKTTTFMCYSPSQMITQDIVYGHWLIPATSSFKHVIILMF